MFYFQKGKALFRRVHACLRHEGYPESRLLFDDGGRTSECGCFPSGRPPSCILCRIRTKTVDEFDEEFHHEQIYLESTWKIKYHKIPCRSTPAQLNQYLVVVKSFFETSPKSKLFAFTILVNRTVIFFVLFRFRIFAVTKIPGRCDTHLKRPANVKSFFIPIGADVVKLEGGGVVLKTCKANRLQDLQ